ncbi:uncharacterized protein K489DRAFT_303353, partial [Dissoconium aciculare CBS 342.82]|uniref:R3H domain-containing protein n=1 Tax=Dissoconium aciculare CBS 342.82 TaxID=1314786 RepID=A0A6J3M9N7_9PEZI
SSGRGRRRRGNAARPAENRTVNGRAFGGRLTQQGGEDSAPSSQSGQLQGAAPTFVPGQPVTRPAPVARPKREHPRQAAPPKPKAPKSQALDIATRTHEDIDNGHYECAICTSEVRTNSKVWSCHTCWTVFHLHCVKVWSASTIKQQEENNRQGGNPPQWRCPGCNLPKDTLPTSYTCWCEKEYDPKTLAGIPPHSCGQTCGRERVKKCPHPCQLTCHAGPCPPCSHMGPTQACFCGKHQTTKRCTETDYSSAWTCGEVCNAPLACGEHACTRPCHEGPCGPCQVRLPARCYCGKMEKDVLCGDRGIPATSYQTHRLETGEVVSETWTGLFECENLCEREFDCGVHQCLKRCHPQDGTPGHCPKSADVITHCTCGKTALDELMEEPRTSCEDAIPSCGKPCSNSLTCGHLCPRVCHSGKCPPCQEKITINCRCGRTSSDSLCHQGQEESPQCRRICRANLNCGRHACEEHCCAGERKAVERLSNKRKQRPLSSAPRAVDDGFEAEHICTRQCGRLLKCGTHYCDDLCHKGPCGSCKEAIFEEISCNCGQTVLMPPLPCGTRPPPCRQPCRRPKGCGHPQVPHTCHLDSESCPKCPFLVERRCMCGKRMVKNQQCWLVDIRCGEICGKKLRCGYHFCRKPCHRSGECEDANGQACQQPCGKEKKACGHPDEAPCHAPYPCKEEKPCTSKMFITCECQAQKQEVRCGASKNSEGNTAKTLPCNDECARLERNRKLAVALNIDQSTHVDGGDHIPFSNETLTLFASHPKRGQTQEREFRVFAAAEDEKRLRFNPMQASQRAFIHALADDFGFDSESVDPEPHRHVLVWKTPRFVSAPNKTLADALRLRQQSLRSANVSDTETGPSASKPHLQPTKPTEPFNSFVIKNPRFALTLDEVRTEVLHVLSSTGPHPFTFDIEFLPSEEVVLKANTRTLSAPELERLLQNLRAPLTRAIASRGFGSTQLCYADSSLNVTRLESDATGGDGWSRVAAK